MSLKQKRLPKTRVTTPRWALQRLEFYRTSSKLLDIHLPPLNSYSVSVLKKELNLSLLNWDIRSVLAFIVSLSNTKFQAISILMSHGDTKGY